MFKLHRWMRSAGCLGSNTDTFFPEYQGNTSELIWETAKKICAECPVKQQCLALAMEFEHPDYRRHGMWGGLTPDERDSLHTKTKP